MALYLGQERGNVLCKLHNIIMDTRARTRVRQMRHLGAISKEVLTLRFMQVPTWYTTLTVSDYINVAPQVPHSPYSSPGPERCLPLSPAVMFCTHSLLILRLILRKDKVSFIFLLKL